MARTNEAHHENASDYGSDVEISHAGGSEYGSTFGDEEETLIEELLSRISANASSRTGVLYQGLEVDQNDLGTVVIHKPSPFGKTVGVAEDLLRVGRGVAAVETEEQSNPFAESYKSKARSPSVEVDCDTIPREARSIAHNESVEPETPQNDDDTRSPLDKFRTKPKKPLSVTDLVSPAWCELQYYYNLSRFGRVPRTRQMKQGSKIHKTLEDEVHDIVPVQVKSKEDHFGLNIWNTIGGLRALKVTGLTRELKIWGIIQGQVVNAVIDELSYKCPDPAYEEAMENAKKKKTGGTLPLESGQLTLAQALAIGEQDRDNWSSQKMHRVVYISDVKTRGSKTVPMGASLRSTWMQLMLYRRLLESLALNTVDAHIVFDRYDLKAIEPFTDVFMRGLDDSGEQTKSQADDENPFSILEGSEVKEYNNLSLLWSLMITELQSTFSRVSEVLRAEFRYAATGEIIGSDVFAYASSTVEAFIEDEMKFWKGEREAKGVEIEEAFKCRSCDFGDTCEWRKKKIEEATEKHRLRAMGRAVSVV